MGHLTLDHRTIQSKSMACTNIIYFCHFKDSFEKISGNAKKYKKLQEGWSLNEFCRYLRLGLGEKIGKKQDGAEIQNCNDSSQGDVFAHMKSVNFFHEIGF
jgi:hypothetical protein